MAVAILAGACSSSGTVSESAPSALPVSVETDGLSVTVDDVVSAVATSSRKGDATVLTSPTTLDAQITVADEALPDEVSGDEITATVLSFDSEVDGASAITFELGPDGAEFDEPVLLEWEGPWAPNAAYSLAAFHGDGTPVEDTGSTDANSIAALRVEPTSDTTARYTLPVDHFSTWSVYVSVFHEPGTLFYTRFSGQTEFLGVVGEDSAAAVKVVAGGAEYIDDAPSFRICTSGRVVSADRPVTASFDRTETECVQVGGKGQSVQDFGLTLRCSAAGAASVGIAVYSLVVTERDPAGFAESGPKKTAELKGMMLRYSFQLKQRIGGKADARINDGTYRGAMFATQTTLSVTCEDTPSTSTSSTTSTTTTILDTTTTNSSTTTTTTKPATVTSTTSGDTVPATPTTAGGTPSVTTPTTAPPTSAAPVTTAAPTTTAPATSTPGTTPPPTSWGPAGAWAYNEFGSCDYNGSGGCGWYFSRNPGTYTLGPIGSPGATIPV